MHAQMRPDGAIVLTIENSELIDIESALMNGETICQSALNEDDMDEGDRDDVREAAEWLEKLGNVLGAAEGRPPGAPKLRSVK